MYRLIFFTFGILLMFTSGCATYQVSGIPSNEQRCVYRDGRKTMISQKENAVTMAVKEETVSSSDRLEFIVAVNNLTAEEIVFSTENISAVGSNLGNGEEVDLHVYSYDELVAEEKKNQTWQAIAVALGGIGDSMNAANAGYSNTYGTYSATTYDYGAAQAAQNAADAKTNAEMARTRVEGKAALEELSSTILKMHTVFPGEWHGGTVQVDAPGGTSLESKVDIFIKFGEDNHSFYFSRVKVTKANSSNTLSDSD